MRVRRRLKLNCKRCGKIVRAVSENHPHICQKTKKKYFKMILVDLENHDFAEKSNITFEKDFKIGNKIVKDYNIWRSLK